MAERSLAEEASAVDVALIIAAISGDRATEVPPALFIRYLVENCGQTVERAKNTIYALADSGKLIITDRYTIRHETKEIPA